MSLPVDSAPPGPESLDGVKIPREESAFVQDGRLGAFKV